MQCVWNRTEQLDLLVVSSVCAVQEITRIRFDSVLPEEKN